MSRSSDDFCIPVQSAGEGTGLHIARLFGTSRSVREVRIVKPPCDEELPWFSSSNALRCLQPSELPTLIRHGFAALPFKSLVCFELPFTEKFQFSCLPLPRTITGTCWCLSSNVIKFYLLPTQHLKFLSLPDLHGFALNICSFNRVKPLHTLCGMAFQECCEEC